MRRKRAYEVSRPTVRQCSFGFADRSAPPGRARKRGRKQQRDQEPIRCTMLCEPVNAEALSTLASCKRAGVWRPSNGPTLRKIIADILAQADRGAFDTAWWEEDRMETLGRLGRRYSGYTADLDSEDSNCFTQFARSGVNKASIGRSQFGLPGWLRDVGRIGAKDRYVLDMANAHPTIQHRRHQHLRHIREYVQRRGDVLASVPCARDDAKLLFIRLVYGGHWDAWCAETGVNKEQLPLIVKGFHADQEEAMRLDCENNPELLDALKREDPTRAEELLQYVLNTQEERRAMDLAAEAVQRLGGEVLAYEHDGLFVRVCCGEKRLRETASAAAGYELTAKACAEYSFESVLDDCIRKSD